MWGILSYITLQLFPKSTNSFTGVLPVGFRVRALQNRNFMYGLALQNQRDSLYISHWITASHYACNLHS